MKSIPTLVLLVVFADQAAAQDRVLGLLSLPEVFGPQVCAPFEPTPIALHAAPNDGSAIAFVRVDQNWSFAPHGGCEGLEVSVHQGSQHHDLPTREYDYETPGAIVVEHRDGWFKVKLHEQSAWLKASPVDRFMPIADLYEEFVGSPRSINPSPDGFRARQVRRPGRSCRASCRRSPCVSSRFAARVGSRRVLSNSACTAANDGPPEVVATGWLPLHNRDGEPTVWFSSRGLLTRMPYEIARSGGSSPSRIATSISTNAASAVMRLIDALMPSVQARYSDIQSNQEDWGWFIWFRKDKVKLAIDVHTDDGDAGEFRIRLTSHERPSWLQGSRHAGARRAARTRRIRIAEWSATESRSLRTQTSAFE